MNTHFLAFKPDLTALCLINTKENLRYLSAPSTNQACETQDFALVKLETYIAKNSSPCEMTDFQHCLPDLSFAFGKQVGEFTSDHMLDDLFGSHLANRSGNDMYSIAENSQAICDHENFFQAVTDKEYSYTAFAQLLHNGK